METMKENLGALKDRAAGWFEITDNQLAVLKDQVVVLTGGSSGIGLATVDLLLSLGAKVVNGDINPPASSTSSNQNLTFVKTDVTSWTELSNLFKTASSQYGRIDHAFANTGIGGSAEPLDETFDPTTGELLEPSFRTYEINLRGVINTVSLAFHYMRRQERPGSVVLTASASSFQRFSITDYAAAKHAVLGLMRGCVPLLESRGLGNKIRINSIAPSWTVSGLLPAGAAEAVGRASQTADKVARSVAVLMADHQRNGQLLYIVGGKYREIDQGVLLKAADKEILGDVVSDDQVMQRMRDMAIQKAKEQGQMSE